ncbi:CPBP family intramembrane metalloprotease [Actinoplanes bogorensis]|uniref:CPBP family intramembrane metalloprotease n=1 Tax=Paractinoplanes bogorensis TaxID=1610840 RepID=A0ABS5YP88_9ACTN|nr:type II CAAX endopeptidase family protein [Actinoplanes bogorensis]MBU2665277.1 CPBP family intramembrane metalloprotease [Actinoplanes bogorensis]
MERKAPGPLEIVVALIAALVFYGGGITLLVAFPVDHPGLEGVLQLAFSGLAPLAVFAVVVLVRIRDVRAFGLRRVERKWLLRAVLLAAACLAVILTFDHVVAALFPGIDDSQGDLRAASSAGIGYLLATIALGGLLTPLGEELLFRGVLTRFLERWGPWVAVLVSAFVFALWHGINLVFPSAFLVGLVNGWLLVRTRSVWPGVVLHVVYNTTFLIIYSAG